MQLMIIHKFNYVPEEPFWLILPQQWDQQDADNHPKPDGTWCAPTSKHYIL